MTFSPEERGLRLKISTSYSGKAESNSINQEVSEEVLSVNQDVSVRLSLPSIWPAALLYWHTHSVQPHFK